MSHSQTITLRLDQELLDCINKYASRFPSTTRSEVLRILLRTGLTPESAHGITAIEVQHFVSSIKFRVLRRVIAEMTERTHSLLEEELAKLEVQESSGKERALRAASSQ